MPPCLLCKAIVPFYDVPLETAQKVRRAVLDSTSSADATYYGPLFRIHTLYYHRLKLEWLRPQEIYYRQRI